jgi:hypothetical protein
MFFTSATPLISRAIALIPAILIASFGALGASGGAFAQNIALGAPVQVMDNKAGMPIFTINLPQGWTYTSDSIWDANADVKVNFSMQAKSPDGMESLSIFPNILFSFRPVMAPVQYAHFVVEQMKKTNPQFAAMNYRIVSARDVPVPAQVQAQAARMNASIASAKVVGEFIDNGVPKTEVLDVQISASRGQGPSIWNASMSAMSGKRGNPDFLERKMATILGTRRMNPQWAQRKDAMIQQWQQADSRTLAAQSAALARQRQENARVNQQILDSQRAAADRRMDSMVRRIDMQTDGILGRDNRTNPYTGRQFKSDVNVEHVWVNSDNKAIGTNNPDYNPNIDSSVGGGDWKRAPKGY